MNTSEQISDSREPGLYFVSWHHSTNWFPAQWTGIKWIVNDEDGHPDFHKDADFDFIDERRIERPTPQQQPDTLEQATRKFVLAATTYAIAHGQDPTSEESFKAGYREGAKSSQPDELSKAQARIRELEAQVETFKARIYRSERRWKPIEALPEDIRDGIERIYAIWDKGRFHSHTRSLNREWLVAGVFTHYFELPTQP